MSIKELKIYLKSLILAILFFDLFSCGKEGQPHPPIPKEKIVKEINIFQIGENIELEIGIPDVFLNGFIKIYLLKAKNPQKKELKPPPESAIYENKNIIFKGEIKEGIFKKRFSKGELEIEENYSTFWGFKFEKGKNFEKTKVYHFIFTKAPEPPLIENFEFVEEGILFKFLKPCNKILLKKSLSGFKFSTVEILEKIKNVYLDKNVKHGTLYEYYFYCIEDDFHYSEPLFYSIFYEMKFKPSPPEEVIILKENGSLRIEFKKVEGAIKYRLYEKCPGSDKWNLIEEREKNFFKIEEKNCKFGIASLNAAGYESEIVEAR